MQFRLQYLTEARDALKNLEQTDAKKYYKVAKTLALMEINLHHPGLQTHKFDDLSGPNDEEVFEAYVENKTPRLRISINLKIIKALSREALAV